MGGKTGTTTQNVQIPPEVLARYNAVNARAETVAQQPFQQYSTDPSAFVAQLNQQQLAGIGGVNQYANAAQPGYQAGYNATNAAMQQLNAGQNVAQPYFGYAQNAANAAMPGYQNAANAAQAGMTPLTQATYAAQPAYQAAMAGTTGASSGLGQTIGNLGGISQGYNAPNYQAGVQAYMSPYLQNAMGSTAAMMQNVNQQQQNQLLGQGVSSGAFGGDRGKIAQAALMGQQNLALGQTMGQMAQQGYTQAAQNYMAGLGAQAGIAGQQGSMYGMQGALANQYGQLGGQAQQALINAGLAQQQGAANMANIASQGMQGATQYGALGTAAQNAALQGVPLAAALGSQYGQLGAGAQAAGLQGAQAQIAAGTLGQQTQQAGLTALYNQFLQQQAYPFQVAQFLGNMAMGTGALSGSQTTTTQPMSWFSDRRLKHDIKQIGESNEGLPIYAFKYKQDPDQHTHVGFMADEVEKVRPDAVGLAGGYKTVNYDKIANDNRAEGGAVGPQHEGLGFMAGGREHHAAGMAVGQDYNPYDPYNPTSMQNILALQKAMFAAPEQHYVPLARQITGGIGKSSRVPETMIPVGQLMKAGPLPDQQPSTLSQGIQAAETGEKIARLFDRDKSGQAQGIIARASDWMSGKSGQAAGPSEADKAALAKKMEEEAIAAKKAAEEKAAAGKGALNDLDFGFGNHEFAANGGRIGYALNGSVEDKDKFETPQGLYSAEQTGKLNIPTEMKNYKLLQQSTLPGTMQDPTAKDAMDVAKFAAMLFLKSGGRAGYEGGGEAKDELDPYLTALRKIESSHNYSALGPMTKKGDRAYGAYQVMGANIPNWTQNALGQSMTPDEFLADKAAQDKVARHYFGQAMKKYGTPQDAASVWFTGRPLAKTSGETADITGTTVPKYIQLFNKAAGIDQMAGLDMIGRGESGLGGDQPPSWYNPTRTAGYKGLAGAQYAENEPTTKSDATKEVVEESKAPPTEPSETKGGVSPLDPKYAAWTAQAPSAMEKLATGLGVPKDMQDSSLWVPALAGIGSMLSSRSPFLLPAIGEGLVGAAAAYPKSRQAQADLEATRTGTMAANMAALRGAVEEVGGRLIVHIIHPDGTPGVIPYGDYLDAPQNYNLDFNFKNRSGGLAGAAPAGGGAAAPAEEKKPEPGLAGAGTTTTPPATGTTTTAPAGGATTTTPPAAGATTEPAPAKTEEPAAQPVNYNTAIYTNSKLDPETQALAERTREKLKKQTQTELAGWENIYKPAEQAANGANAMKSAITELTGLLTSLPRERSVAASGALQPVVAPVLKRLNNLLSAAGANTIAEKEIGMQEAINKTIANLKAQAASANNMEAVSALGELGEQFPTFAVSPQGTIRGMARVVLANQRTIDQDNFYKNFLSAATNPNDPLGSAKTGSLANLAQVFQNKMAPQYEKEFKGIEALENQLTEETIEGQKVKVSMFDWLARNGGRLTKEQVQGLAKSFDEKGYGADLLRYFPSIPQAYYLSAQ